MAQKARLNQRRILAQKQRDEQELAAATKELEELERKFPELLDTSRGHEGSDRTAGVNERNRKAAVEDRKATEEAEREARRRKTAFAAVGDMSRPATPQIKDLSARVKTVSKIIHDNGSRFVFAVSACFGLSSSALTICFASFILHDPILYTGFMLMGDVSGYSSLSHARQS